MRYYFAADGGGTKLLTVLYDENLNIMNTARTFGVNSIFKPRKQVAEEVYQMVDELIPNHIAQIECVDMSFVGEEDILLNALRRKCVIKKHIFRGEGHVALASAGYMNGIVAQAGTGSDAFLIQPDHTDVVGGWGAFLGDEGSGYDIGLQTLKAAIYAQDGRGPETMIRDILMQEWQLTKLWDLIEKMNHTPDWRGLVASATRITAKAAVVGDVVALGIFEKAAGDLAKQVIALIRRNGGNWEGPIVASGGAWKGCERMYKCFCKEIRMEYPEAVICRPIFEPLVGSVVMGCLERGHSFVEVEPILRDKFGQYLL